jgi:hypothetical protein
MAFCAMLDYVRAMIANEIKELKQAGSFKPDRIVLLLPDTIHERYHRSPLD